MNLSVQKYCQYSEQRKKNLKAIQFHLQLLKDVGAPGTDALEIASTLNISPEEVSECLEILEAKGLRYVEEEPDASSTFINYEEGS